MAESPTTGARIRRRGGTGHYTLGEKLGEGAEGTIYTVANDEQKVVKVYKRCRHGHLPPRITDKLRAMERHRPAQGKSRPGHPAMAWPDQIIQSASSNTAVGFAMPRVNTQKTMELGEFLNPKTRQTKMQEKNLPTDHVQIEATKYKIIQNLSQIADSFHKQGHLIGDINERNIQVDPIHGDVSITDCDSCQIRDEKNRTIYRCKVGTPDYTAPELFKQLKGNCTNDKCPCRSMCSSCNPTHQMKYACITRSQEHDRFGIAVIAFQLLMDGSHPYTCRVKGPSEDQVQSLQDRIERKYYPYSRHKPSHILVSNAKNQERFNRMPQHFKDMFERAFT